MDVLTTLTLLAQNPAALEFAKTGGAYLFGKLADRASRLLHGCKVEDVFDLIWIDAVDTLEADDNIKDLLARKLRAIKGAFARGSVPDAAQLSRLLDSHGIDAQVAHPLQRALDQVFRTAVAGHAVEDERAFRAVTVEFEKATDSTLAGLVDAVAEIRKAQDAEPSRIENMQGDHISPNARILSVQDLARLNHARDLLIRGRWSDARRAYEQILGELTAAGTEGHGELLFRVRIGLGTCLFNSHALPGRLLAARRYWESALHEQADDPALLSSIATLDLIEGDVDQAVAGARAALIGDPSNRRAKSILAQAILRQRGAEAALTEVYAYGPRGIPDAEIEDNDADGHATVSLLFGKMGQIEAAFTHGQKAVAADGGRANAWQTLGWAALQAAVSARPDGRLWEMVEAVDQPRLRDALEAFEQADRILGHEENEGERLHCRHGLMQAYSIAQRFDEALETAKSILATVPGDASAIETLCLAGLELGKPQEVLDALGALDHLSSKQLQERARALTLLDTPESIEEARALLNGLRDGDAVVPEGIRVAAASMAVHLGDAREFAAIEAQLLDLAEDVPVYRDEINLTLGTAACDRGHSADAERYLEPLCEHRWLAPMALLQTARNLLYNRDDADAALLVIKHLRDRAPQMAGGLVQEAVRIELLALHRASRWAEFCTAFEEAKLTASQHQSLTKRYLDALTSLERHQEALAVCQSMLGSIRSDFELCFMYGRCLALVGEAETAIPELLLARRLSDRPRRYLVSLMLSNTYAILAYGPQAVEMARKAYVEAPVEEKATVLTEWMGVAIRFGDHEAVGRAIAETPALPKNPLARLLHMERDRDEIVDVLMHSHEHTELLVSTYNSSSVPFCTFAAALNKSVPEAWMRLRDQDVVKLKAFAYTPKEREIEDAAYRQEATVVVPDFVALLTSAHLGTLGVLANAFERILVPMKLFQVIQANLVRLESPVLRAVWEFLRHTANVELVSLPSGVGTLISQELRDVLGDELADSVALAVSTGALVFSDDLIVRQLASIEYGCRTAGTLSLVRQAELCCALPLGFRHSAMVNLTQAGYALPPIEPETVLWAAQMDGMRVGEHSRPLLDILGLPDAAPQFYLLAICRFLSFVVGSPEYDEETCRHWLLHLIARCWLVDERLETQLVGVERVSRRLLKLFGPQIRNRSFLLGLKSR